MNLRNKWFWFTLRHWRIARIVYWLSMEHWRMVFIEWYFERTKKYCWADLVLWALKIQKWRDMNAPNKCGYCYSCMTKEEVELDVKAFVDERTKVKFAKER